MLKAATSEKPMSGGLHHGNHACASHVQEWITDHGLGLSADTRVICQGGAGTVSLLPRLDRQGPAHGLLAVRLLLYSDQDQLLQAKS